jgi:hypothetical protein
VGKEEFAPDRIIAYRFAVELDLPHKFISEEELAEIFRGPEF